MLGPTEQVVNFLVFGPIGSGKTVLVGSAADDIRTDPCLFVNLEAGTMSIASKVRRLEPLQWFLDQANARGAVKGTYLQDFANRCWDFTPGIVDELKVASWEDLIDVVDAIRDGMLPYRSVALDSLSEINYLNITNVVKQAAAKNFKHNGEIAELQDYNRAAVRMRDIIRQIRDLPIHTFLTCLPMDKKDEMTGAVTIMPSMTGKLSVEVPAMMDIVGYMAVGKGKKRVIHFISDGAYEVKDRSEGGKLGDELEFPTVPMIFDLLGVSKEFVPPTPRKAVDVVAVEPPTDTDTQVTDAEEPAATE